MQIIDLLLNDTTKALSDKNISLEITEDAKKYLLTNGIDLKYGARPLRRAIQRYIEDELSDMLLRGELKNGQTIFVNLVDNKLDFMVK